MGKQLKLDDADAVRPYLDQLAKLENVEEVRFGGNTLGVEACEAIAKELESKRNLRVRRRLLSDRDLSDTAPLASRHSHPESRLIPLLSAWTAAVMPAERSASKRIRREHPPLPAPRTDSPRLAPPARAPYLLDRRLFRHLHRPSHHRDPAIPPRVVHLAPHPPEPRQPRLVRQCVRRPERRTHVSPRSRLVTFIDLPSRLLARTKRSARSVSKGGVKTDNGSSAGSSSSAMLPPLKSSSSTTTVWVRREAP